MSPRKKSDADGTATAISDVKASSARLIAKATALAAVDTKSPLTTEKLQAITRAYGAVTADVGAVDSAIRALVDKDPVAKSIRELLPVASLNESLRAWFPVDPEMTAVQGTLLVPQMMTEKEPEPEPEKKPEKESIWTLLKRLLAHLAE